MPKGYNFPLTLDIKSQSIGIYDRQEVTEQQIDSPEVSKPSLMHRGDSSFLPMITIATFIAVFPLLPRVPARLSDEVSAATADNSANQQSTKLLL